MLRKLGGHDVGVLGVLHAPLTRVAYKNASLTGASVSKDLDAYSQCLDVFTSYSHLSAHFLSLILAIVA